MYSRDIWSIIFGPTDQPLSGIKFLFITPFCINADFKSFVNGSLPVVYRSKQIGMKKQSDLIPQIPQSEFLKPEIEIPIKVNFPAGGLRPSPQNPSGGAKVLAPPCIHPWRLWGMSDGVDMDYGGIETSPLSHIPTRRRPKNGGRGSNVSWASTRGVVEV